MPFCYAIKRIERINSSAEYHENLPDSRETTESLHSTLKSANRAALEYVREEREDEDIEATFDKDGYFETDWDGHPSDWDDAEWVRVKVVREHLHGPDLSLGEVDSDSEVEEVEGLVIESSAAEDSSDVDIVEPPSKRRRSWRSPSP